MAEPLRCLTLGDFNLETFNGYLANDPDVPAVAVTGTDFGQVQQLLMDPQAQAWKDKPDAVFVWTRPEAQVHAFRRAAAFEQVDPAEVLAQVDAFAAQLLQLRERAGAVFVATWTTPSYDSGLGLLDLREGIGVANLILRMNLRLAERLEAQPGFYVLNAQKWLERSKREAYSPKLWYMAKVPFGNEVLRQAALDVKAACRAIRGHARKLVVLDLDDTLWGGLVGEVGWQELTLGGHDPLGEAFRDFQEALKALTRRGILLGIVSKNEEDVALQALREHPEMVLRPEDFAGWRINWDDKARNMLELVQELNLGLQSAVFIDDTPVERARVREALPEVLVPDWPEDKLLYRQALLGLRCFDTASLGAEDRKRASMYAVDRERKQLQHSLGSIEDWLESLQIQVTCEPLGATNLPRAAQLLNKTNQMNLSTRRMSETELEEWAQGEGHRFWTFRVADKFGDLGLVGLLSVEPEEQAGRVVDFVLSCRAFGRRIEETMAAVALQHARERGWSELRAAFVPTAKNRPCLAFWSRSGFEGRGDPPTFHAPADRDYPVPAAISLARKAEGAK